MNLELLNEIDSFVWGPPLLVLLVGTGVFLSLRLGFLQVARLPKALYCRRGYGRESRRTRRAVLDVGGCVLRHGDQIRGRVAGCEIPRRGRTRRNCRRSHVLY